MSYCCHGPAAVYCGCDFTGAIPSEFSEEMARWILENVPEVQGIFLVHFEAPIGDSGIPHATAQHFLGWAQNVREWALKALKGLNRETRFSHIVNVANAKGVKWHIARIWVNATESDYHRMKSRSGFCRKCPECR